MVTRQKKGDTLKVVVFKVKDAVAYTILPFHLTVKLPVLAEVAIDSNMLQEAERVLVGIPFIPKENLTEYIEKEVELRMPKKLRW